MFAWLKAFSYLHKFKTFFKLYNCISRRLTIELNSGINTINLYHVLMDLKSASDITL